MGQRALYVIKDTKGDEWWCYSHWGSLLETAKAKIHGILTRGEFNREVAEEFELDMWFDEGYYKEGVSFEKQIEANMEDFAIMIEAYIYIDLTVKRAAYYPWDYKMYDDEGNEITYDDDWLNKPTKHKGFIPQVYEFSLDDITEEEVQEGIAQESSCINMIRAVLGQLQEAGFSQEQITMNDGTVEKDDVPNNHVQ